MKKQFKRRSSPRKLRAIQTSRHWRVSQHHHTGHLTHHRSTSYPILAMIVLCVGVFLVCWTRFVTADSFVYPDPITNSYTVHASVPGPAPTQPATIDVPADGTKVTDIPITVSGSCPLNTYVTLYRNSAFSGVALCSASGSYELQTGLFPGANQLQARVFSPTDVPGPMSNMVTVYYQPPIPPTPPSSSGNNSNSASGTRSRSTTNTSGPTVSVEPLILKTIFKYSGHYVGQPTSWQLDVEGGTAPYAVAVDWGDGSRDLISRAKAGTFSLGHTYKKAGGYRGSYVTAFSASDADHNKTFLQLLAIVNNPPGGAAGTGHTPFSGFGNTAPGYLKQLTKYIWPGYGIVVLMLTSFWLGERRELRFLQPRLKKIRRT